MRSQRNVGFTASCHDTEPCRKSEFGLNLDGPRVTGRLSSHGLNEFSPSCRLAFGQQVPAGIRAQQHTAQTKNRACRCAYSNAGATLDQDDAATWTVAQRSSSPAKFHSELFTKCDVTLSSHFPFFVWATEASEDTNTSRQSRESHVETSSSSRCVLHCCVGVGVMRHAFHLAQFLRAQTPSLKVVFTAHTQGACSQLRRGKVPVRSCRDGHQETSEHQFAGRQ